MSVPFVDLRALHEEIRAELEAAFSQALDESAFHGGPSVTAFEAAFAVFCGVPHAIAVASGTDALELSLRALGVGAGDIVITTPNTFMATVEAIRQTGGVPRFVDIDPTSYAMAPGHLCEYLASRCERTDTTGTVERASGLRVRAVIPVHLFGLPAAMPEILQVAREFGLGVVEDACQAHGAEYPTADGGSRRAGSGGDAGCFSFYPAKNLGALGEAGAVVTAERSLDEQVRILRDHGQAERYIHLSPDGVNARMDSIQARFLSIKLARLDEWNDRRRRAAKVYASELADLGIQTPVEPPGYRHAYHLYVVRVPHRDEVRARMAERGIGTGVHYPVPLHRQPALAYLALRAGEFPEAERAAREVLSLPMYPQISDEQINVVAETLRECLE